MGRRVSTAFEASRYVREMTQSTRNNGEQSAEETAEGMNVSVSQIYAWGEPDSARRLPADLIPLLTRVTGDTLLIERLNEACGIVGVPLPTGEVDPADLAGALREFGELVQAYADGAADGEFDDSDIARLDTEAWDVLRAVVGLMAAARESHEHARNGGRVATLAETA